MKINLHSRDVRAIPLISASRWLVKRGDCLRLSWKESGGEKLTFGRRVHKQNLALFLFTDLLVVAKRKSEERFVVLDYSPRNMIQVCADIQDCCSMLVLLNMMTMAMLLL